jgi:protein ImuB
VKQFIRMPRTSLRKRFGQHFLTRLDRTLGYELEIIDPVVPVEQYEERLHCLDPIVNSSGIEIALEKLLTVLCSRLAHDQKGLRTAILKCYRTDGKTVSVDVGTNRPSHSVMHLFKLFELKLQQIEPGLGIELFILIAPSIEDYLPQQEKMWGEGGGLDDNRLSELIDRLAGRISMANIHRYLPDEHYWPERSFKSATCLGEELSTYWRNDKQRPVHVLPAPERIEVTAPIPDYPPMLFRYKGKLHQIIRADGPERIEQEWWLQQGQHRDYYRVEDEEGKRYWLFRLGHYHEKKYQWFLHGFFS